MSSLSEWQRLAKTTDERSEPHHRTKGPASVPAQRVVELNSELMRVRGALGEACTEIGRLAKRLERYEEFGGVSFGGIQIAQIWADFFLWEGVLNDNPQLRGIIELGTWNGGFSWWLWGQTEVRNMSFYTFDAVVPEHRLPPFVFEKRDIFADADKTADLIRLYEPCVVFCDNGNKPRELQTFAPALRDTGSLLVVHDWGDEVGPDDVPDTVEMVYEDACLGLNSKSRVFRLKGEQDGVGT